ncbi:MAG: hypothetical protein LBE91_12825 [Tannerella sp.]|jgi:hypothetical protein|nr:hypothetical protein [Tannerella sp.]
MEKKQKIQKTLFEEMARKIASHERLAEVVCDMLNISSDSAYRRIRGETELTLSELVILCSHFNVSLDSIFKEEINSLIFRYNPMDILNLDNYRNYIHELTGMVSSLSKSATGEIFHTAEDIPLFHYLRFRELALFKVYTWFTAVSGSKRTFEQFVKEIEDKEILYGDFDNLQNSYLKIPSSEVWTDSTIEHILRSLKYYHDTGVFETKEMPELLSGQVQAIVENLERWVETGKKENEGDFKLYCSAISSENNFILLKNEENTTVAIRLYTVKNIVTSNPLFCEETERWMEYIINHSVLLSGSSAKERAAFFQNMKTKINDWREKLMDEY